MAKWHSQEEGDIYSSLIINNNRERVNSRELMLHVAIVSVLVSKVRESTPDILFKAQTHRESIRAHSLQGWIVLKSWQKHTRAAQTYASLSSVIYERRVHRQRAAGESGATEEEGGSSNTVSVSIHFTVTLTAQLAQLLVRDDVSNPQRRKEEATPHWPDGCRHEAVVISLEVLSTNQKLALRRNCHEQGNWRPSSPQKFLSFTQTRGVLERGTFGRALPPSLRLERRLTPCSLGDTSHMPATSVANSLGADTGSGCGLAVKISSAARAFVMQCVAALAEENLGQEATHAESVKDDKVLIALRETIVRKHGQLSLAGRHRQHEKVDKDCEPTRPCSWRAGPQDGTEEGSYNGCGTHYSFALLLPVSASARCRNSDLSEQRELQVMEHKPLTLWCPENQIPKSQTFSLPSSQPTSVSYRLVTLWNEGQGVSAAFRATSADELGVPFRLKGSTAWQGSRVRELSEHVQKGPVGVGVRSAYPLRTAGKSPD
ncbi:hypothetical protein JZ751_013935 [Albula glossodonta]|uniref:Uncharacterized protein n=1 Tax=Albula glossodonta TaxID=121402 RepID=A0A8T2N0L1_9TELE|nr:hypothetical protein JZ751_013935 [Albula glossodonta]